MKSLKEQFIGILNLQNTVKSPQIGEDFWAVWQNFIELLPDNNDNLSAVDIFNQNCIELLDLEQVEKAITRSSADQVNESKSVFTLFQVSAVAAALGLHKGVANYDAQQAIEQTKNIKDIFSGELQIEPYLSLLMVFGENKYGGEEGRDIVLRSLEFLQETSGSFIYHQLRWDQRLLMMCLLDFLLYRINRLHEEQIKLILDSYYYAAVLLGVPVKNYLQDYLLDAGDIISFVIRSRKVIDSLEADNNGVFMINKEQIPFKQLLHNYLKFLGDDLSSVDQANKYISQLSQDRAGDLERLSDMFDIYGSLRQGILVDWLKDTSNDTLYDQARLDMSRLFYSLGWNTNFVFIVDYFKDKLDKPVTLKAFIKELSIKLDLNTDSNMEMINNCLDKLQSEGLLDKDVDLIIFDEQKHRFEWDYEKIDKI